MEVAPACVIVVSESRTESANVVLLGDGRETVLRRLVGINQARDVLPKTVKGVAGGGGRRVHCLVATAGRIALQLRKSSPPTFFVLAATAKHGKYPKGKGAAGADGEARQRAEDGDVGETEFADVPNQLANPSLNANSWSATVM